MFTTHTGINSLREAGTALNQLLAASRDKAVLLLVPTGSAFSLVNRIDPAFLPHQTTITMLNERYAENGAGTQVVRLKASPFWERMQEKKVPFIDPSPTAGELPDKAADRFDKALQAWHAAHPKGIAIALMGIGTDGHIADIFPHTEVVAMAAFMSLFESDPFVCGYRSDKEKDAALPNRITVTNTYLRNHVDHAIVYVVGEQKHESLATIYNMMRKPVQTPACIIREMKQVEIYTDIHLTADEMGKTLR
jgi:6-phosphogluconolactonase/glucosamine-6-phosphate isomerase/deaminase